MNGVNLLADVSYISACLAGNSSDENERRHDFLRWDLEQRNIEILADAVGYYEGAHELTYVVVGDLDVLLDLSRRYGQRTLLHRGVLYDVDTREVLATYNRIDAYVGEPDISSYTRIGCVYIVLR